MRRKFERFRASVVALAAIIVIAIGLSFSSEPQQAQSRNEGSKRTARTSAAMPPADKVTAEIRKGSNGLIHVPIEVSADREKASQLGTIVSDHGSFVIALADESVAPGSFGDGAYQLETTIHLPGAVFDPLKTSRLETVHPGFAPKFGPSYFVVQLGGIATDDVLDSIRASGFEVIQYIPHNAFIVFGESSEAGRVAENSRVRWVGELTARHKIPPTLEAAAAETSAETSLYNIAVFSRANLRDVARQIARVSGARPLAEISLQMTYFNILRVQMSPSQLDSVASIPDVVRIDSWTPPAAEDERAAQIVAGNYTNTTTISAAGYNPLSQFGADGTNVTVAVSDDGVSIPGNGGFYLTAANTLNIPDLRGCTAGAEGGHGHLNASIIAGAAPFGTLDPLGYNYGLGIAPKAHILNIPFIKDCGVECCYTGTDATAANDAVTTNGPNGVPATISNNSWGGGTNSNAYDSSAALYDSLTRDASTASTVDPLLFVFSAGNCGTGPSSEACSSQTGLTRPKVAKNLISVGSSENLRSFGSEISDNMDDISSFSSKGPTADGRIKPDIIAPGDTITGSRAGDCGSVSSCFDGNHVWSQGTSHSAPQVSGVAALFTQFWKGATGGLKPSPAITKAAILLSGQEMAGNGASNSLPNGVEGWGRVNMQYILNPGVAMRLIDQNVTLSSPGQQTVYTGRIADSSKPFRVALVWTDPPGAVDPALVNNLDLTVNVGGVTYRGNNFAGGISISGGSSNTNDNVEQVRLAPQPANTQVVVTISAGALNGDGAVGNGDTTDQHFALVLYNFEDAPLTHFGISGRALSAAGRGVANVNMVLSNGSGVVATTFTNSFGYFLFSNILGGESYTLTPVSRRYAFDSQVIHLGTADMTGLNFTATTGLP